MFNPTEIVIEAFVRELKDKYGKSMAFLSPPIQTSSVSSAASRWRTLPIATRPITT